jgi:cytochrome c2
MALAGLASMLIAAPAGAATGQENFTRTCAACHSIGEGKRVGPDLKGVTERRTEEWLLKFIKSSQTVVKSGDATAVALFEEYNKTPMPDSPYSEAEIKDILEYIKAGGGGGAGAAEAAVPADPAVIQKGGELFEGRIRLANGGPACNSCHHVKNDAVIGGGVLAKELTQVFSTMGGSGVRAVLGQPPFPVMTAAYKENPIKPDEIQAIVAFLQDADKKHAFQQPRDFGMNLLVAGSAVFVVLMALFALIWRRRKVLPVNHAVFERQVRTE